MKRHLIAVIGACILLVFMYQKLIHISHTSQVNTILKEKEQHIALAYDTVKSSYQKVTTAYFEEKIMDESVLTLLRQTPHASNDDKALIRGQLYRHLWPLYKEKLRPLEIRQLHFHLPDGESFLRFHSPGDNADNLMDIRTSIKKANTERTSVFGFEGGRIYPGFRHVFPLIDKGVHLGSVEISNSFEAFITAFNHVMDSTKLSLIMKKEITSLMAFSHHLDYFIPSFFSNDYVMEHPSLSQLTHHTLSDLLVKTTHKAFKDTHDITDKLNEGQSFSLYKKYGATVYTIHFIPINDTNGELAAYVVGYNDSPEIALIFEQHIQMLLLGFLGIIVLGFVSFMMLRHRHLTLKQKKYIETIANTMMNGLFVLNKNQTVDYVNERACSLLGYAKEELLNKDIHSLIHVHNDEEALCPILESSKTGIPYSGEEIFRKKDAQIFPVSLSTSSLYDHENKERIGTVTIFRDITKEVEAQEEIQHLAYYDALTNVPNRKLFFDRLTLSLSLSERQQSFGGLVYLDLDNLKSVNDTLGHQAGDELIVQVTQRLLEHIRNSDTLARLGGDEFVILLNNLGNNKEEALKSLEMIVQKIQHSLQAPCHYQQSCFNCHASMGVILFLGNLEDENSLLKKADKAMYEAKNAGKNQYIIDSTMPHG